MFKLTEKQKQFLHTKKLKIGKLYTFPNEHFIVYTKPNYFDGIFINRVPYNHIRNAYFEMIEERGDFLEGFAYSKVGKTKVYMRKQDILSRTNGEVWMLYFFCYLPMIIYNLFTNKSNQ